MAYQGQGQGQFMQTPPPYGANNYNPQPTQPHAGKNQQAYGYPVQGQDNVQGGAPPMSYVENNQQYQGGTQSTCLPIEWIFFIVGWIFPILWLIACFLPLCRKPRFENGVQKGGWIACMVVTIIGIIIVIIAAAAAGASSRHY